MNKTIKFLIDEENNGQRIDIYLAKNIKHLSRSYIKKLIEDDQVKINKLVDEGLTFNFISIYWFLFGVIRGVKNYLFR